MLRMTGEKLLGETEMSKHKIAIVVAEFNTEITDKLLKDCIQRLADAGIPESALKIVKVPGAVEIPLIAKLLAKSKKYDVIIAFGAVIHGETNHYDYVCQLVTDGCLQVMLETEIPVIYGILTTQNYALAKARVDGTHSFKGAEWAQAAIDMLKAIEQCKC
jgi:6,7-dimethyl-8-ribityllumazine synthase